ncbi:MAG: chondroitinase-B domain-containing protein [Arthrobacter sp.]
MVNSGPPAPRPWPPATSGPAAGTLAVSSTAELQAALAAARPGETIALKDGTYTGKFVAAVSGTEAAPITLTGSRAAVLSSGSLNSGYGLHITGSHWQVSGLSVAQSAKGIVLDGSVQTVLRNVDVGSIGSEAVHFRANSTGCAIQDSEIHDTGLAKPGFGEGIYVGSAKSNWTTVMGSATAPDRSDRVLIGNNHISRTSAEGIDIKEGTTGGNVIGNSFSEAGFSGANSADSWVDVKGNGYTVAGNSGSTAKLDAVQVHNVLDGWGRDNTFSGNTVLRGVPGYEVWIQSSGLGNIVRCQPSAAGRGLANIQCTR